MPKPSSLKDQCPIFSTVSWKSWVYLLWYVLDTWVLHKPHPAGLGRQNIFWFKCYRTQGMTWAPLQTPGLEHEVVAPQSTAVPQHMLFLHLHLLHRNTVLPFSPPSEELLLSPALSPEQCQPPSGTSIISDGTSWLESGIDLL